MKPKRLLLISLSSALLSVVLTGVHLRAMQTEWNETAAQLEAEYKRPAVTPDEAPQPADLLAKSATADAD
jgi:hypothetical protein